VPWRKLEEALGYDLKGIDGCLISHEHQDHCRAITEVIRNGIDVYASAGTFEALGTAKWRRTKIVADQVIVNVGDAFQVMPFSVVHDVAEPLGYVVRELATGEYLLFAIDTCLLTQWFIYPFSIIAIGCNYDADILQQRVKDGDIHETVAKRLLFNHPSKQWVDEYLRKFCDLSRCREIHLLHTSGENLDKQAVRREIEKGRFITVK
jgi:phosphoribosyl 1,2-cyclic phosphodiesterase